MSAESVKASSGKASFAWLLIIVAVALALAAFSGAISELVRRWIQQEEYSHGFFIPIIAAWLLWNRREAIAQSIGPPSWTGPALILLAGGMLIIGELSALFMLAQLGFIVALLGIALAVGGSALLRVVLVPILMLIFAIPLPYFIDSTLSWRLQIISSQLGVGFIKLLHIPVYLEGNVIDLGDYKLQVLEACSGLRYLYPLMSLGFLAAYLFKAPLWKRVVVFLSTIPITIGMNSLRIGIVGATVSWWGIQMAEGVLHFFEGWIIFLACAGLLILEMYALARIAPKGRFSDTLHVPKLRGRSSQSPTRVGTSFPLLACLALLGAAGVVTHQVSQRQEIIPERPRFASFPMGLGDWKGVRGELEPDVESYLGVDDYLLSDYAKGDSKPVNLYVAYYSSQRKGVSPHSPQVCIPGGGWQITQFARTTYANQASGLELPYNRVVIERGSDKQIVYYWFDQRGRNIANEYVSKWYLLNDAIFKNRTDGALVRLTTAVGNSESERDADERLQAFLGDVEPSLRAFLPASGKPGQTACSGSC